MGTPDFAVPSLAALIQSRHDVVGVVTNPDRRSGRGKKVTPTPVKRLALEHGIEVYQPKKLRKNEEALAKLAAWEPDMIVVAAYGQILPVSILELPELGCLNVHASLLPAYRGAAPINWCIVRGEEVSGVTIMEMEKGLDTGPMILKGETPIPPDMIAQELHDALAEQGAKLLPEAIDGLLDGSLKPTPQDHDAASWAPMISKEDGLIDWGASAKQVCDLIRGFNPWPGTYTYHHGVDGSVTGPIKLHLATPCELGPDVGEVAPGQVVVADASDEQLIIAAGDGKGIACLSIQAPGRRAMGVRDFLNGYELGPEDRFGPPSSD